MDWTSWSQTWSTKRTTTIPWNLAKLAKTYLGVILRQHRTDRKLMGLLREQCVEVRKGHLRCCCSPVWATNGARIPWNAILICERYLLSDGKTPYERRFGELLKDQSSRLVHWLSITLLLRKTSQESINLERKSYLDLFLGYALYAGWIWKGDKMVADMEELETMDASEIYSKKTQCKGSHISQTKWKIHFSSRRWTNKICWRRSGTENIHLDTGPPNSRRRSNRFSWRIRRVSTSITSRLISGCRWSDKWLLVHVRKLQKPPSRWTQSQTLLAERRIIPYSNEMHWRLQNYTYELGCYARKPHRWLVGISMDQGICLILGQVSLSSLYWVRNPPDGYMWSGGRLTETASDIQARSFMARTLERNGKECSAERKT